MAQTFGISVSQVQVPKYQETKLEPLNSADLSRYFTMAQQQKQFALQDAAMKTDMLVKAHEMFKNFDYMTKDADLIEPGLNQLMSEMSQAKTTMDAINVYKKTAEFMLQPTTIQALREKKYYDQSIKTLTENSDKFSSEALDDVKQIFDLETRGEYDPETGVLVRRGSMEKFFNHMMGKMAESSGETPKDQLAKAQLEYTQEAKRAQTNLNIEKEKEQELKNKNLVLAQEAMDRIMKDPNVPQETKNVIQTDPQSQVAQDLLRIYGGKPLVDLQTGDVRELVQAITGKNPPSTAAGRSAAYNWGISYNDPVADSIFGMTEVTYVHAKKGIESAEAIRNKDGSMNSKIMMGKDTDRIINTAIIDGQGDLINFALRPFNNNYVQIGNGADADIYDDSNWYGYGDYQNYIPELDRSKGYAVKSTQRNIQKVLGNNDYGIYEKKETGDPNNPEGYYIGTSKDAAGERVFVRFAHDPSKSRGDEPVQRGVLETNNPQLIKKFINDNKGRGDAWLKEHLGFYHEPGNLPVFVIKDAVWSPYQQSNNIQQSMVNQAMKTYLYGGGQQSAVPQTNKTNPIPPPPPSPQIQEALNTVAVSMGSYKKLEPALLNGLPGYTHQYYAQATEILGTEVGYANEVTGEEYQLLNQQINTKLGLNNIEKAYSVLPAADKKLVPGELLSLHPYLAGLIQNSVYVADQNELQLLSGISDIVAGNKMHRSDRGSYHHTGLGLDFSMDQTKLVTNPNLTKQQAGALLFQRIINEALAADNSSGKKTPIKILVEAPTEAKAKEIREKYNLAEVMKGVGNPTHYIVQNLIGTGVDPHLHVEFQVEKQKQHATPAASATLDVIRNNKGQNVLNPNTGQLQWITGDTTKISNLNLR